MAARNSTVTRPVVDVLLYRRLFTIALAVVRALTWLVENRTSRGQMYLVMIDAMQIHMRELDTILDQLGVPRDNG